MAESIVAQKSFQFAIRIVKLYQYLKEQKQKFVLAKQLLRSGTSIGANTEEAVAAQLAPDFIYKLHLALKETRETSYWLRLMHAVNLIESAAFESTHKDCAELQKMLSSIILTSKKKTLNF
ncbi:four helix bundle protein [Pontibacter sp. SGAir0037]|uniref:four helix bundle protein n=1 Tax=Pontibacter sp. SGAir0037 TaxID=2571030 RepID=UPI0010CCB9FF|nr:four helix bundle protein [Pontibacter sp. SGAir0037]QCR23842.1 four helix bundle protein [Pontibacter sp. SGAir0037]